MTCGCLFGQGFLLPLEGAGPVFVFFLIKLCLPFASRLFAGSAGVPLGVATNAIAMMYVVKELALEFAGDRFSVNGGGQIRSFESRGERRGELMG